jgi:LysR family transcriptional regulator, chromosome initiation inhibitor
MLDYAALAMLAAVVREGSFERAARVLHVTPSAVSQRIRLLEERIGCALVVRSAPCRPTETGRRLCQHVDRVRLLEQDLHEALPAVAGEGAPRVVLPLAVNADSLATWFAPALARFAAGTALLFEVAVDDQDHTAGWLRSGAVLAAVTGSPRPPSGCNSRPLGRLRYVAAASPAFIARHFAKGVTRSSLARAPSLQFSVKDELQARWVRRHCRREVELPRHLLPSSQAFVAAALDGMGWGMQPLPLVAQHLAEGRLQPLLADAMLDVPLHWQYARAASRLIEALSRHVEAAARAALLPP